jgi:CheY-like chemotaxis protein
MANYLPADVLCRDLTVLVVDDDLELLLLCATQLRSGGYAVLMALGSVEAQAPCEVYP